MSVRPGNDEFDRLAGSVNTMLERIESLNAGMRAVIDSLAHDLRKPLTRALQSIEQSQSLPESPARQQIALAEHELKQLQRTLNALLHIAQAESHAAGEHMERVDLQAVVRDIAELYEPLAHKQGIRIDVDAPQPVHVLAHHQLLAQALSNLLDNCLSYASAGKRIELSIAVSEGRARLSVGDQGPGIAPENRARAVDRFVRLAGDDIARGSGLGLSLVAAVARLHGGALTLEDADPGLRVSITLPLVNAQPSPTVRDAGSAHEPSPQR